MDDYSVKPQPRKVESSIGKRDDELGRIEWMLTNSGGAVESKVVTDGPLVQAEAEGKAPRLILDTIGEKVLKGILVDTLNLLGTSAAVYEKDGTSSMGYSPLDGASSWTTPLGMMMRATIWRLEACCATTAAGANRRSSYWKRTVRWIGHVPAVSGSTWSLSRPTGRRSVRSTFGYGDPPQDLQVLKEMAEENHLDAEQLIRAAQDYRSRPLFMVEAAKTSIRSSGK